MLKYTKFDVTSQIFCLNLPNSNDEGRCIKAPAKSLDFQKNSFSVAYLCLTGSAFGRLRFILQMGLQEVLSTGLVNMLSA